MCRFCGTCSRVRFSRLQNGTAFVCRMFIRECPSVRCLWKGKTELRLDRLDGLPARIPKGAQGLQTYLSAPGRAPAGSPPSSRGILKVDLGSTSASITILFLATM